MKWGLAILLAIVVVALPFLFRRTPEAEMGADAAELIIISPHNEAIRQEFAEGSRVGIRRGSVLRSVSIGG